MRRTQDKQVQDWSELLTIAREDEAELAASAQETTRQMKAAFAAGRGAAIALRSYIRAVLGPRSEKLLRYGIKPLRQRRRVTHGRCGLPN